MFYPYGRSREKRQTMFTVTGECLYYDDGDCLSPVKMGCEFRGKCKKEGIIIDRGEQILNRKPTGLGLRAIAN